MGLLGWCSRRVGGLSLLALIALCYWVIYKEYGAARQLSPQNTPSENTATQKTSYGAGIWTYVFAYYCLFIHLLVFIAPVRACKAVWDITESLRREARALAIRDYKQQNVQRRISQSSISSAETLTSDNTASLTSTSEATSDTEVEEFAAVDQSSAADIVHAIVIPNYKEEVDTLRETLEVLASHSMAATSYDVYLAMEQREEKAESKALDLIQRFVKKFRAIDFTIHPPDIPGEAAGKGSNMAWAAKKLSEKYLASNRKNVVVTGIDSDSHLSSGYFAQITSLHLSHPDLASTTVYCAPIIFDRNAHNVPALVRTADVLWCAAGMSGLYRGSVISPPTSVYSLPLELVDRTGGWDTDAEAIGEDLHMYIKCFFTTNGTLTSRTIMSPVSQSNITSGKGAGIRGAVADIGARYKQALRHMWGALDSGYALRKGAEMWRDRKRTSRAFRPVHQQTGDVADYSYLDGQATGENTQEPNSGIFSDITRETISEPNWERIFYLFHRLFEAHFLPVHMAVLVISSGIYLWVTDGNGDPKGVAWSFTISNILRTGGFMAFAGYLFLYESYHRLGVKSREREMRMAGLSTGMSFSHRSVKKNIFDYTLIPLVAPLYGTIPAMQAVLAHFWTVDLVYTVSKKATRQRSKSMTAASMA